MFFHLSTDAAFKEEVGVSHTQLGILRFLEQPPGAMLKEVSDELGINASTITALVGRMEEAGLVRREFSDEDARVAHIYATSQGLPKASAARPALAKLNARLMLDFNEKEIRPSRDFFGASFAPRCQTEAS